MLKRMLCFIALNHQLYSTGFEEKGSDFRYVYACRCGKRVVKDQWTDDNHLQGYGTSTK